VSREDLVALYASGNLSRRAFIRRLVAAGVSFGAAVSYAHLLEGSPQARAAGRALGDGYGLDDPPTVVIDPVAGLYDGDGAVTLRGRIDTEGRSGSYHFRIGRAANPFTWLRTTPPRSLDAVRGRQSVSETLDGLRGGEEYFAEISASTNRGWRVSEQVTFRAPGGGPIPVALAPAGTADNDGIVTLRGTVDTGGSDTVAYFRVSTSSNVGSWQFESSRINLPGSFNGPEPIDAQISGLQPGFDYYVRVSAASFAWRVSDNAVKFRVGPGESPPSDPPDTLGPVVTARGISTDLAKVRESQRLVVGVHANENADIKVKAFLVRGGDRVPLGRASATLRRPYVEKEVRIALSRAGRRALAKRNRATVELEASGADRAGNRSGAQATFELS
jgi:hypothetical protein